MSSKHSTKSSANKEKAEKNAVAESKKAEKIEEKVIVPDKTEKDLSEGISLLSKGFGDFVKSQVEKQFLGIVTDFIHRLVTRGQDKKLIVDTWNEACPEFVINLENTIKSKSTDAIPGSSCSYFFKKKKVKCERECSRKSKTGLYCSQHLKEENKEQKEKKSDGPTCDHDWKSGEKQGTKCGAKVGDKSTTGRYCNKHYKDEQPKKVVEKKPKEEKEKTASTVRVRLHDKLDVYVDEVNGWAFNKNDKKVVFGKVVKDKLIPLSDADVSILESKKIPFNREQLKENEPENEEGENEGEEEENEEGEEGEEEEAGEVDE